jgi:hypothetical protein
MVIIRCVGKKERKGEKIGYRKRRRKFTKLIYDD